jgi:RHS repeat-associated protein
MRYEPYGKVRYRTGTSPLGPRYEFTGYETQGLTGLQYAGARFYDPAMGTFLTHDPAAQFTNPYTYTGWDPANRVDPTGALAWWIIPMVASIIAFNVTATQALINGASPLEAMTSGTIAGAIAFASASILGPVGEWAHGAGWVQYGTFLAVTLGSGAYGVAESFRAGQNVAGAFGAILLAYGLYRAIGASGTVGARPSGPNDAGRLRSLGDDQTSGDAAHPQVREDVFNQALSELRSDGLVSGEDSIRFENGFAVGVEDADGGVSSLSLYETPADAARATFEMPESTRLLGVTDEAGNITIFAGATRTGYFDSPTFLGEGPRYWADGTLHTKFVILHEMGHARGGIGFGPSAEMEASRYAFRHLLFPR